MNNPTEGTLSAVVSHAPEGLIAAGGVDVATGLMYEDVVAELAVADRRAVRIAASTSSTLSIVAIQINSACGSVRILGSGWRLRS